MTIEILGTRVDRACHLAMDTHRGHAGDLLTMRGWCVTICMLVLGPGGCGAGEPLTPEPPVQIALNAASASARPEETRMWMKAGEHRFAVTLADNTTARAFATMLPLTLDLAELNGNEKHASLPQALPTSASRPGAIRSGDLMLYGTDTLVVFYSTFNSPYSYTRIGRVDAPTGLAQALGRRGARVVFSRNQ